MLGDSPEMALLKAAANVSEKPGLPIDIDALIQKGWRYRDFPRMEKRYWEWFKRAFGTDGEDYHVLTDADYGDGSARGQLLLSPMAIENLKDFRAENPLP